VPEEAAADVVIDAERLAASTETVLCKRWKAEQFEIYFELSGKPVRITLDETRIRRVADGNPNPLEWRFSEEVGEECVVRGDLTGLVHGWMLEVDELEPGWSHDD